MAETEIRSGSWLAVDLARIDDGRRIDQPMPPAGSVTRVGVLIDHRIDVCAKACVIQWRGADEEGESA
jgi:hypothetical protein